MSFVGCVLLVSLAAGGPVTCPALHTGDRVRVALTGGLHVGGALRACAGDAITLALGDDADLVVAAPTLTGVTRRDDPTAARAPGTLDDGLAAALAGADVSVSLKDGEAITGVVVRGGANALALDDHGALRVVAAADIAVVRMRAPPSAVAHAAPGAPRRPGATPFERGLVVTAASAAASVAGVFATPAILSVCKSCEPAGGYLKDPTLPLIGVIGSPVVAAVLVAALVPSAPGVLVPLAAGAGALGGYLVGAAAGVTGGLLVAAPLDNGLADIGYGVLGFLVGGAVGASLGGGIAAGAASGTDDDTAAPPS